MEKSTVKRWTLLLTTLEKQLLEDSSPNSSDFTPRDEREFVRKLDQMNMAYTVRVGLELLLMEDSEPTDCAVSEEKRKCVTPAHLRARRERS